MAIRRAEQEGAVLTSSEAILFELLKEAGTPAQQRDIKDCKVVEKKHKRKVRGYI